MDNKAALTAFDALSQSTRLDALRLLIQAGSDGLPAGEIGERLDVRQNTMSVNLKILCHAGLIEGLREGRNIRYYARYDSIQALILFLMQDCCGGKTELRHPILDQARRGC